MTRKFYKISGLFIILILSMFLIVFTTLSLQACTLWAATGEATEDGATMVIKNRDWDDNHYSQLMLLKPQFGYSVLALYATGGDSIGIKAGINEKGLVVVTATASSLPKKERTGESGLMTRMLFYYDSVASVLEDKELLTKAASSYCMLGDREKIAFIEVAPDGNYSIQERDSGFLCHTNHYLDEELLVYNKREKESSFKRLERIRYLLENYIEPFTKEYFIEVSQDQNDGPDNSIWRTGSTPESSHTVGTWFVTIPKEGPPEVYVKIVNTPEGEKVYDLNLDSDFWESEESLY